MARSRMTSAMDLDADPRNLYNKRVSVPNGTFNQGVNCDTSGGKECTEYSHTLGSWSVAPTTSSRSQMALFARINQGVHFPGFDDLRNGQPADAAHQQLRNRLARADADHLWSD